MFSGMESSNAAFGVVLEQEIAGLPLSVLRSVLGPDGRLPLQAVLAEASRPDRKLPPAEELGPAVRAALQRVAVGQSEVRAESTVMRLGMSLVELREIIWERNGRRDRAWRPGEREALLAFRAELVHDLELVDGMLRSEAFIGRPRLLREDLL